MSTPTYYIGTQSDNLDSLQIWWTVSGALVDFSVPYTYQAKIVAANDGATPPTNVLGSTKTTGFAGTLGSGVKGNGVPNLVVSFTTTELNAIIAKGLYIMQIRAVRTSDGGKRTGRFQIDFEPSYF